jgi:hypothetical protein
MTKYKWSLYKSIEFLNNRRPDLEIRASFIQQLSRFEKRLNENLKGCQTENWTELASRPNLENEELIITNTFLNSQIRPFVNDSQLVHDKEILQPKVSWIDNGENNKEKLVTNTHDIDLLQKKLPITLIVSHRTCKNMQDSILKQAFHIHPDNYNFTIKDEIIKPKIDPIKLDDSIDNIKYSNISTHTQPKDYITNKFYPKEILNEKPKPYSYSYRGGSLKSKKN